MLDLRNLGLDMEQNVCFSDDMMIAGSEQVYDENVLDCIISEQNTEKKAMDILMKIFG